MNTVKCRKMCPLRFDQEFDEKCSKWTLSSRVFDKEISLLPFIKKFHLNVNIYIYLPFYIQQRWLPAELAGKHHVYTYIYKRVCAKKTSLYQKHHVHAEIACKISKLEPSIGTSQKTKHLMVRIGCTPFEIPILMYILRIQNKRNVPMKGCYHVVP